MYMGMHMFSWQFSSGGHGCKAGGLIAVRSVSWQVAAGPVHKGLVALSQEQDWEVNATVTGRSLPCIEPQFP